MVLKTFFLLILRVNKSWVKFNVLCQAIKDYFILKNKFEKIHKYKRSSGFDLNWGRFVLFASKSINVKRFNFDDYSSEYNFYRVQGACYILIEFLWWWILRDFLPKKAKCSSIFMVAMTGKKRVAISMVILKKKNFENVDWAFSVN